MISGNRDEAWPMYLAWPIPERFMLGVIWWHVTCMLSLAGHWQDRRALSNHVCAHSVIPMWHVICLQHLARASSEQSRSTTVLPINHVIQIPQCLSGFVNHDYWSPITIIWLHGTGHIDIIGPPLLSYGNMEQVILTSLVPHYYHMVTWNRSNWHHWSPLLSYGNMEQDILTSLVPHYYHAVTWNRSYWHHWSPITIIW